MPERRVFLDRQTNLLQLEEQQMYEMVEVEDPDFAPDPHDLENRKRRLRFYLRNGLRHLAFYKAVKKRFGYDNPAAFDLAANTMAAHIRAGNADAAADVVKTYPEYVVRALGATEERDRLARELARARRRFVRTAWIAAIAVAATVLMLLSAILP